MYDSFLAVVVCLFCSSFLLEIVVNDVLIGRKFSYKKIHEYINITLGAYHLCSINYERKAGTQLLITKSFNPTKNNLSQAMNEILLNREIKKNKKKCMRIQNTLYWYHITNKLNGTERYESSWQHNLSNYSIYVNSKKVFLLPENNTLQ